MPQAPLVLTTFFVSVLPHAHRYDIFLSIIVSSFSLLFSLSLSRSLAWAL